MTGVLRLHPDTARRYYRSYLNRMHSLHSFLDRTELNPRIQTFIQMHCADDFILSVVISPGKQSTGVHLTACMGYNDRLPNRLISPRKKLARVSIMPLYCWYLP